LERPVGAAGVGQVSEIVLHVDIDARRLSRVSGQEVVERDVAGFRLGVDPDNEFGRDLCAHLLDCRCCCAPRRRRRRRRSR
jgi:hypothetical protein